MPGDDAETWLLEEGGEVIERMVAESYAALSPRDRLIYCLWVADYGMRNAGNLVTAADLHAPFLDDGRSAARELGLPVLSAASSLTSEELERRYFGLFDGMIAEIKAE